MALVGKGCGGLLMETGFGWVMRFCSVVSVPRADGESNVR